MNERIIAAQAGATSGLLITQKNQVEMRLSRPVNYQEEYQWAILLELRKIRELLEAGR